MFLNLLKSSTKWRNPLLQLATLLVQYGAYCKRLTGRAGSFCVNQYTSLFPSPYFLSRLLFTQHPQGHRRQLIWHKWCYRSCLCHLFSLRPKQRQKTVHRNMWNHLKVPGKTDQLHAQVTNLLQFIVHKHSHRLRGQRMYRGLLLFCHWSSMSS